MSEQNRAIIVRAEADPESERYSTANFDVKFHFLQQDSGKKIDFKLFEILRKDGKVDKKVLVQGTKVTGTLSPKSGSSPGGKGPVSAATLMAFKPDDPNKSEKDPSKPRITFYFDSTANPFFVPLPDGKPRELQIRVKLPSAGAPGGSPGGGGGGPDAAPPPAPALDADAAPPPAAQGGASDPAEADGPDVIASPYFNVSGHFIVPVGTDATYDWYSGNALKFYANASDDATGSAGAFHDITEAIKEAKHFVFIADWSFHPYMTLARDADPAIKDTIGGILVAKAKAKENKDMVIAIHTWCHPISGPPKDNDNDYADLQFNDIAKALQDSKDKTDTGERPKNLLWRASYHRGVGYSHHQKMVLVDYDAGNGRRGIKAFFGGLDLTKGRFDWWAHPIMPAPESKPQKGKSDTFVSDPASSPFVKAIVSTGYGLGRTTIFADGNYKYDDWYNAEFKNKKESPRQPWHDIYAQITGPAAWDMVREFVGRWNVDSASPAARGDKDLAAVTGVVNKFAFMLSEKKDDNFLFLQQWEKTDSKQPQFIAQVLRSIVKEHWGPPAVGNWFPTKVQVVGASAKDFDWILAENYEKSIQEAYIRAIAGAQRFVYIESQYFIGAGIFVKSVQNQIQKTIIKRVRTMIDNNKPFHVYVVLPMYPEGDPDSGALRVVREYEASSIEYIATNIQDYCNDKRKKDKNFAGNWRDYVSFYFPARWDRGGQMSMVDISGSREERVRKNQRYMIYVHSKMMIVDDEFIIIGSANLNERSLAGNRDTEICIGMTAEDQAARDYIQKFRLDLWSKLLGNAKKNAKVEDAWKTPETPACVSAIRVRAENNYFGLRTNTSTDNSGFLCVFPMTWGRGAKGEWVLTFLTDGKKDSNIDWPVMPDAENEGTRWIDKSTWRWDSPAAWRSIGLLLALTDIPE